MFNNDGVLCSLDGFTGKVRAVKPGYGGVVALDADAECAARRALIYAPSGLDLRVGTSGRVRIRDREAAQRFGNAYADNAFRFHSARCTFLPSMHIAYAQYLDTGDVI